MRGIIDGLANWAVRETARMGIVDRVRALKPFPLISGLFDVANCTRFWTVQRRLWRILVSFFWVWRFYYLVTDGRNIMVESIFFFSRSSEVRGEVIWMMDDSFIHSHSFIRASDVCPIWNPRSAHDVRGVRSVRGRNSSSGILLVECMLQVEFSYNILGKVL